MEENKEKKLIKFWKKEHNLRNFDDQEILKKVQGERKKIPQLFLEWIPEKENRGADQLARQALQQILGR